MYFIKCGFAAFFVIFCAIIKIFCFINMIWRNEDAIVEKDICDSDCRGALSG